MTDRQPKPDFEGFARAILEAWPTGDIEGSDLFDLCVSYGMVAEIAGGYDPDRDIDAHGICPERGDPWYEYTFGGESGPGLYSVFAIRAERDAMRAENERLRIFVQCVADGDPKDYTNNMDRARAALQETTHD